MKNKKVLVIGGAGFVGSHVAKELYRSGYEPIIFDNFRRGNRKATLHFDVIEGDTTRIEDVQGAFAAHQIEAVLHFAALTDVRESIDCPKDYYGINVAGTLNVLEAMLEAKVNHFIFSSSAAVYGLPTGPMLKESDPLNPITPYGHSKLMVEQILSDFDQAHGLKFVALRYFNAAGGDPDREIRIVGRRENNLIPIILNKLNNGERSISLFGGDYPTRDGSAVRDYVHVMDLARAHVLALENLFQKKASGAFNLGSGGGFSVFEVVDGIERVTGETFVRDILPRRLGDPPSLVADSIRAEEVLGWRPKLSTLDTMIADQWGTMKP